MSKDKKVLFFLILIAIASFAAGAYLLERVEKDGMFQGQSTWLYLNNRFRSLLSDCEKKKERFPLETPEAQAQHARLLHNVGITYAYSDQWADSLKFLNQSLDFKMKSKSVSAESLIQSIESLGKSCYLTGDYDSARTALDFAARDWVRESGEDCKNYARCLSCTGRVNLSVGKSKAAELCFDRARVIFKKEEDRSSMAKALLRLAECDIQSGDLERASQHLDEAIPLFKVDLGEGYRSYFNDDVALLKCLEGQVLVKGKKQGSDASQIARGIELIKEAVKETYVSFGDDDVYTQNFRLALAEAYLKNNDASSCLAELAKIETSFEKIGLPHHPFLKPVYELHLKALGEGGKTLSDALLTKLKDVQVVSSQDSVAHAKTLSARLNPSAKFLSGRSFTDPWMLPLTLQIIGWAFSGMFACAMASAAQAGRKDYSAAVWFMLGVIFNFAAYLVICALPSRNTITKEFGADFAVVNDARAGIFLLAVAPLLTILAASIFYYPAPIRDIFIAIFLGFFICLILYPPIWCFVISKSKGRNPFLWTLIGLVFSIFGAVVLLLLPPTSNAEIDEEETRNTQAESTMLIAAAIHLGLFLLVVVNICSSWMLHIEL